LTQRADTKSVERIAAFLLTLEKDTAAAVLKHLEPGLLEQVVEAMSTPRAEMSDPANVNELYRRMVQDLRRDSRAPRRKSEAEVAQIVESTVGKPRADALLGAIRQREQKGRPFKALEGFRGAVLSRVLTDQSDAVIALVLRHFEAALAAEVLAAFAPERSLGLVRRMAELVPPDAETMLAVAQELAKRAEEIAALPPPVERTKQIKSVAELLNHTQGDLEKTILDGLSREDGGLAKEIRELMFCWEDLATLERRAMQKVLAAIDTRTLAIALKAADPAIESNITNNLSARVRDMIKDEREIAGALPLAEVHKAREQVMTAVRALMESGEFRPAKAGEQLVT
jgi:flagellar motor switch protein FliG